MSTKLSKSTVLPKNISDLFFTSVEKFSDREVLKYKVGHHYHTLTYSELYNEVIALITALKKLGFKPGDRAMLISENRPEWVISDLAFSSLGIINVPIHSVLSSSQLAEIVEEIKPKAIFFSDHDIETKLLEIAEEIAKVTYLVSFESIGEGNFTHLKYFKKLIEEAEVSEEDADKAIVSAREIDGDEVCTVIYTSGTTGHLKGVQLTHNNLIQNIVGVLSYIDSYPEDKFFSILPLSHVLERTCGYYLPIYSGSSIGYALDMTNIAGEIKERKPTVVIAVPRLFEKIYEKIMEKANSKLIKKLIFKLAFMYKPHNEHEIYEKIFDKLVFKKIRDNFGGEIRFFVSGGAKLSDKLGPFFERVGLLILEGYGLTETSPVVACNTLEEYKFGTVGLVLPNLKVKIGSDQEILVKGPCVMKGYLRESDNQEAFTKDGWFKTGDLGYLDKDKMLVITGRRKDLIVLSTGKKIAPVPIEEALEMSLYIEQACVFGEGRKHVGALIVPSFDKLKEKFGIHEKDRLLKNQMVLEFLDKEIISATEALASIERIKKYVLVKEVFSVDNGELTPTLKLRRKVILDKYKEDIDKIYSKY